MVKKILDTRLPVPPTNANYCRLVQSFAMLPLGKKYLHFVEDGIRFCRQDVYRTGTRQVAYQSGHDCGRAYSQLRCSTRSVFGGIKKLFYAREEIIRMMIRGTR